MQKKQRKRVAHTALIIPVPDTPQIHLLREQFDPAFPRWMPHINLLFPFLEPHQFQSFATRLSADLSCFPSFTIKFNRFGVFKKGTSVLFLQPEVPNNQIQRLFQLVAKIDPDLARLTLSKSNDSIFHPHCTVAKFKGSQIERRLKELHFEPFQLQVKQLHLIAREKETPFEVVLRVSLSQSSK